MPTVSAEQYSDWAASIRGSDQRAFSRLFRVLYPALYRYAFSLQPDTQAADDLVQEAFVRMWQRRDHLDPASSVRGLLYATVRNLALNKFRNRSRRDTLLRAMEEARPDDPPDELVGASVLQDRIRLWIHQLPERRREAFELSRYDGLSYEEIGQVMGLSTKTVENHIRLALDVLRRRLHAYDPEALHR